MPELPRPRSAVRVVIVGNFEQVLLHNVALPPLLTAAIQEKLQGEHFQNIVAKGISAELPKRKAIEGGLPIILSEK